MTSIGILGGTGPQGRGLARRLSAAGHEVVVGSRSVGRAQAVADRYTGSGKVRGGSNQEAAAAHLVIVAVPYAGHAELLASLSNDLAGKIVIDCVNPLTVLSHYLSPRAQPLRKPSRSFPTRR
jgi:8-hydroxy-5-deazaflavin:NADPH oxidoreductase